MATGRRQLCAVLGALLGTGLMLASGALAAPARIESAPAAVTEIPLSAESLFPGPIAEGHDGNMWQLVRKGQQGHVAGDQNFSYAIDRIAPTGEVTEFALPGPPDPKIGYGPRWLTAGPEEAIWYLSEGELGRVTTGGEVTEFPVGTGEIGGAGPLTEGPDGNLWFTEDNSFSADAIVRVTPAGQATSFPLAADTSPGGIVSGPDGNLWFTESRRRVARITSSGSIAEFHLPKAFEYHGGLVPGPEGAFWFTTLGGIGRMTPNGQTEKFTIDPDVDLVHPGVEDFLASPSDLMAGSDGRLWFFLGSHKVGRMTPTGRLSSISLPNENERIDLAPGPGGTVWYTSAGQPPCEGGGGTCMAMTYLPGMVGRIEPAPQQVTVEGVHSAERLHQLEIRLGCAGGRGDQQCSGRLRLKLHGLTVVKRTFAVIGDGEGTVTARLGRRARRLLNRPRALKLTAVLTLTGAGDPVTTRAIVTLPPARGR